MTSYKKYLIFIAPVLYMAFFINNGTPYIDDLGRNSISYGWSHDGRYLSTIIYYIASLGTFVNIHPIPTILASLLVFLSGLIIANSIEIKDIKYSILFSIIPLSGPFIIENFAYKWDSLPMSISMLIATIPLLVVNRIFYYFLVSIISIVSILFIYQSSIFIYTISIIIYTYYLVCVNRKDASEILQIISISILSFLISIASYFVIISIIGSGYKESRGSTVNISSESISYILSNFKYVFKMTSLVIDGPYIIPLVIMSISILFLLIKNKKITIKNRILFIIFLFSSFFLSFATFILIKNQVTALRIATPFNYFVFLIFYFLFISNNKIFKLCIVIYLVTGVIVSASYNNAIKSQYNFEKNLFLSNISGVLDGRKKLVIIGESRPSPEAQEITKAIPHLKKIIPHYLSQWYWSGSFLYSNGIYGKGMVMYGKSRSLEVGKIESSTIVKENRIVTIRENDNVYFIIFK
ncbi:TPA: glucosyltransferase domain-containing protein [Proteus mirabilis]|nr:glucosyltransferase domain-containing protein [Proteus mirabilis]EKX2214423.1 glucosyltransferase domain-containing protein [Proteus mirabilis]ELA7764825.1 glucosyltransferase domain-containing protein [Proteus mirabilis]MBG2861796.1 glucosyltransferase domain-containing protein [Proteus mirabilis]HEK0428356.1 glucosyltransferase domain-containing protein [Proteus mirabilis]